MRMRMRMRMLVVVMPRQLEVAAVILLDESVHVVEATASQAIPLFALVVVVVSKSISLSPGGLLG